MDIQHEQKKRTQRAHRALATGALQISPTPDGPRLVGGTMWQVTNGKKATGPYQVTCAPDGSTEGWACSCPDFVERGRALGLRCKHVEAVRLWLEATRAAGADSMETTEKNTAHAETALAEIVAALSAPFPATEVKWKPQAISRDKARALAVAYIDARAVMERLDAVVGPFNWQVIHAGDPLVTRLGIKHPLTSEWIWKSDLGFVAGADSSKQDDQVKANKGTPSDGLKRAGVVWGIFRYAYSLPKQWVPWDDEKRRFRQQPTLPASALPSRNGRTRANGLTVAQARKVTLHIGEAADIRGKTLGALVDAGRQDVLTWLATTYNPADKDGARLKRAAAVLHANGNGAAPR